MLCNQLPFDQELMKCSFPGSWRRRRQKPQPWFRWLVQCYLGPENPFFHVLMLPQSLPRPSVAANAVVAAVVAVVAVVGDPAPTTVTAEPASRKNWKYSPQTSTNSAQGHREAGCSRLGWK